MGLFVCAYTYVNTGHLKFFTVTFFGPLHDSLVQTQLYLSKTQICTAFYFLILMPVRVSNLCLSIDNKFYRTRARLTACVSGDFELEPVYYTCQ
jgi:hypothetical protein